MTALFYRSVVKRAIDVVLSIGLLVILFPVIVAAGCAVRTFLGSPVFFRQRRPGRYGVPFELVKFRTMKNAGIGRSGPASDAERLDAFGRFLRASSLDELPELWNVLKGDMSLIGPRPLLTQYLERYTPRQHRRHEVRPGITGLAQVSGRNALDWERKFELDVDYVDRCSFALDAGILALTVWRVIARQGINQPGQATAEEFVGTAKREASGI